MNYDEWKSTEPGDQGRARSRPPRPPEHQTQEKCETHRAWHRVGQRCQQCEADARSYREKNGPVAAGPQETDEMKNHSLAQAVRS